MVGRNKVLALESKREKKNERIRPWYQVKWKEVGEVSKLTRTFLSCYEHRFRPFAAHPFAYLENQKKESKNVRRVHKKKRESQQSTRRASHTF